MILDPDARRLSELMRRAGLTTRQAAVKYALGVLCASVLGLAGCASSGHTGRADTELRGVLMLATNAPTGVLAVLNSRSGTRPPCDLRASDLAVAEDIQFFAAKGVVVIVAGKPGPVFTVTEIWADGLRRRKAHGYDAGEDAEEKKDSAWSGLTWGSLPAREN